MNAIFSAGSSRYAQKLSSSDTLKNCLHQIRSKW